MHLWVLHLVYILASFRHALHFQAGQQTASLFCHSSSSRHCHGSSCCWGQGSLCHSLWKLSWGQSRTGWALCWQEGEFISDISKSHISLSSRLWSSECLELSPLDAARPTSPGMLKLLLTSRPRVSTRSSASLSTIPLSWRLGERTKLLMARLELFLSKDSPP